MSEDNLDFLRERGAQYIVGTPSGLLKDFEEELDYKIGQHVEAALK